jgi:hypothetical protein
MSQNPNFSIIICLFNETIRLFLEFLLEIEIFLKNGLDFSLS